MVASNIKYIESVQTGSIATGGFGADFSAGSLLNSKSSRATSLMKDVRGRLANNL